MRRALVLLMLLATPAAAQDVLSLGSGGATSGGSVQIPVTLGDRTGTPLGTDAGSAIRGIAFKVLYPSETVMMIAFTRAGVLASASPLYETTQHGDGFMAYVGLFHAATSIPLTPNGNDTIGTLTVTLRGDVSLGTSATLRLDPASATLSNQGGTVTETVAAGTLSLVNGSITVNALATPSGFFATATNTTQVAVVWNGVSGAAHYEVWRSSNGSAFAPVASPAGTGYTDNVSAGTTYLYRVRAVDSGGGTSAFTHTDAATTIVFTDDPLTAGMPVKALHLAELRTAVNAMRAAASLAPLAADPTLATGAVIRATHVTALRTGLDEARAAIGLGPLAYADAGTLAGVTVKAVHVQELRAGTR